MASKSPTITIKLLIDQESNKVILAEAVHDFVDTLRSILMFPLGSIARLFGKHQIPEPGCLINLYNSVEKLSPSSFRTHACKHMLLYPRTIHENKLEKMKLDMGVIEPTKFFECEDSKCSKILDGFSCNYKTAKCSCGKLMNVESFFLDIDAGKDESKKELMFFITDDLAVMKGMLGELIQFLHKLGIKDFHKIKEEVLEIGIVSGERSVTVAPNMEETVENDIKTSVKIMLRKSDRKILCAETNEDFVDLLFSFLTIPIGSVLELLQGSSLTIGSISKLIDDLKTIFSITEPKDSQKVFLPPFYSCPKELSSIYSQEPQYFWSEKGIPLKLLDPKSPYRNTINSSGYVEKNSSFLVTDDLVVKSLSSVSIISLLKELDIPLDDVEQQIVCIEQVEAAAVLRACLCSSSALSALLNFHVKHPKQEPL